MLRLTQLAEPGRTARMIGWRDGRRGALLSLAGLLAAALVAGPSRAQESVESFYSRNPITLIVSTAAGGGVDAYSRLLGRHLGKHVPGNPRVVVQNMPGAAGLKAAQYLYNIAAKDGSVIGHVQRGVLIEP